MASQKPAPKSLNLEIVTPGYTDYDDLAMIVSHLGACHCVTVTRFIFISQKELRPINACLGSPAGEAEWPRELTRVGCHR